MEHLADRSFGRVRPQAPRAPSRSYAAWIVKQRNGFPQRATQDSNLRPSAPEAGPLWSENAELEALWDRLGTVAEKYLRAVAGRSRFAHRFGRELAEEVLGERRRRSSAR